MINYTIKQGNRYISGLFCTPCEFTAINPEGAYRWNNKESAERIAKGNYNAVVVEVARQKVGERFIWAEFKG